MTWVARQLASPERMAGSFSKESGGKDIGLVGEIVGVDVSIIMT